MIKICVNSNSVIKVAISKQVFFSRSIFLRDFVVCSCKRLVVAKSLQRIRPTQYRFGVITASNFRTFIQSRHPSKIQGILSDIETSIWSNLCHVKVYSKCLNDDITYSAIIQTGPLYIKKYKFTPFFFIISSIFYRDNLHFRVIFLLLDS